MVFPCPRRSPIPPISLRRASSRARELRTGAGRTDSGVADGRGSHPAGNWTAGICEMARTRGRPQVTGSPATACCTASGSRGVAKWYRNRWVRTDSFIDPFPLYKRTGSCNLRAAVANTHVINHAGKTLALVESSLPYEVTTELETVGCYATSAASSSTP